MPLRNRKTIPLILLLSSILSATAEPGEQILTNLEVLRSTATRAISEALKGLPQTELTSPIRVYPQDANDANWLVEGVLTQELTRQGLQVLTNQGGKEGNELSAATAELSYRVFEFGVHYLGQDRHGLFGRRWVRRLARTRISLQLVRNGEILWKEQASSLTRDEFPKDYLSSIEDKSYPFTKAELNTDGLNKLLEPLIVSLVVGGLIYLFYSGRR